MTTFTTEHLPGDPGRPTLVFLSALFAGGWLWDAPFGRLAADGWPVLRTNEALCALPSRTAGSIKRLGDALVESCDEAGVDDMIVCANSLGGLVAVDLGSRLPERVRGIVVSGAPGLTQEPDIGLSVDRRASVRLAGPVFRDRMISALFHGECGFSEERIAETGTLLEQGSSMVSMARSIRATRTYPVLDAMDQLTRPALFVWGEHDAMTPIDPWRAAAKGRDGVEFVAVDDCGHIPMVETPDTYIGHVRRFAETITVAA